MLRTSIFAFMGIFVFLELKMQRHIGLMYMVEFVLLNPFIKEINIFLLTVLH